MRADQGASGRSRDDWRGTRRELAALRDRSRRTVVADDVEQAETRPAETRPVPGEVTESETGRRRIGAADEGARHEASADLGVGEIPVFQLSIFCRHDARERARRMRARAQPRRASPSLDLLTKVSAMALSRHRNVSRAVHRRGVAPCSRPRMSASPSPRQWPDRARHPPGRTASLSRKPLKQEPTSSSAHATGSCARPTRARHVHDLEPRHVRASSSSPRFSTDRRRSVGATEQRRRPRRRDRGR